MSQLKQIVDVLGNHGLRVVIIGGHAVNVHGYIRSTEDVDVILVPDVGYEKRLFAALSELNAFQITDEIDPQTGIERTRPVSEQTLMGKKLHMVGTDYGYLDIFCFVPGFPNIEVETVWDEALVVDGHQFASLSWLRKLKAASGRPIDMIDLENLPSG